MIYKLMKDETRKHLIEFFLRYNEKLYLRVNRNFDWKK